MNAPSLARVLDLAIRGILDDVRVSLPGRVVSYDKATQRADVQPLIKDGYPGEDGTRKTESLPVVPDVPVAFPGAGGYHETFPISKGDTVLLVFCSSSIARWKASGTTGEIDPGDDRHHAIPDAIAYAGVRASSIAGVPDGAWVITVPSGKQLRLGSASANQSAIMGEAFLSALSTLTTAIKDGLIAAGNTSVGGAAIGVAFQTAITAFEGAASSYTAAKVKVS